MLAWQATNAAVLHLALSTLPARQRRALAAAVPALDALASAIDRLADTTDPADPSDTAGPSSLYHRSTPTDPGVPVTSVTGRMASWDQGASGGGHSHVMV